MPTWLSALLDIFKGIFPFLQKRNERKSDEIPMREEEHEEDKPVRLIRVEIEKIDKTGRLIKEYNRLEKKADKLDIDFEKLKEDLGLFDIVKELEHEENEFIKKIPDEKVKGKVRQRMEERREKREQKRKNHE